MASEDTNRRTRIRNSTNQRRYESGGNNQRQNSYDNVFENVCGYRNGVTYPSTVTRRPVKTRTHIYDFVNGCENEDGNGRENRDKNRYEYEIGSGDGNATENDLGNGERIVGANKPGCDSENSDVPTGVLCRGVREKVEILR